MTKGLRAAVIVLCALAVLAPAAQAARTLREPDWIPNGQVYATAPLGGRLLIAGDFTTIGRRTGPAALFAADGSLVPELNGLFAQGTIDAFAPDGTGGWFVGGSFRQAGGDSAGGLAHLRADGTIDPDFLPQFLDEDGIRRQGAVHALAIGGGRLYAGGEFDHVDGVERKGLAAFALATGDLASWNPAPDYAWVEALAYDGSTVYAGGIFGSVGGEERNGAAALDGTTGAATSWDPDVGGYVYSIAVAGGVVYIGGEFGEVGGMERPYAAAVDQVTGTPTAWNPDLPGAVRAFTVTATTVYVGLETFEYSTVPEVALLSVDLSTGATNWSRKARKGGGVASLLLDGSTLYVGGGFDRIGGVPRSGLAALSAADGTVLAWRPRPNLIRDTNAYPQPAIGALASAGGRIMAGGDFLTVGGSPHHGLALVSRRTWRPLTWDPRIDGSVWGVTFAGRTIYAVGDFDHVAGRRRRQAAAFGLDFRLLPWSTPRLNSGPADDVDVLDGKVVMTGSFNSVGRSPRHGSIAAFDPVSGELIEWGEPDVLGTGFTLVGVRGPHIYALLNGEPSTFQVLDRETGLMEGRLFRHNGDIYAGAWAGRVLFVGGAFKSVEGKKRTRLAAVNWHTGRLLPWRQSADGSVLALTRLGNVLYAGGEFHHAGGLERNGLAALDVKTGAVLPWNPAPFGFSGWVNGRIVTGTLGSRGSVGVPYLAVIG